MHQPIDIAFWNKFSYNEYIHSDWWRARATEYKRKVGYKCEYPGCRAYNVVDVHHKTYIRLGRELDEDLICLCRKHHEEAGRRKSI